MKIPPKVRALLEEPRLAHLVTVNADGSPQVAVIWVGVDGDEIVAGHLMLQHKLRNIERDPRVAISIETDRINEIGLMEYLVVHGTARVTEGGAPELLQELAHSYLGPDAEFPPMPDPPPGYVSHVTPDRFGGVGDWNTD